MPSANREAKTKGESAESIRDAFLPLTTSFQIYWMKDRLEIIPDRDPNFLQASDGHLILIQARERDSANYTCVAENVANKRFSPAARLSVVGERRQFQYS